MTADSGALLIQIKHCLLALAGFIAPALLVLLPVRYLTRIPSYVFRKLLHFVAFTCVSLMILAAKSWQAAALTSVLVAVVLYPLLSVLENAAVISAYYVT